MIYIVDDDRSVRKSLELLLTSANFESKSFESAENFLMNFEKGDNDFLILDIHMPGMDGCGLLRELEEKTIQIPVLIITAYDEQHSRNCAKEYGAIGYLRKPIDGESLIDLINYFHQGHAN